MSLLLDKSVYTIESNTVKRGVYPLHGYKLGLYRLPVILVDPLEIQSIIQGLSKTFEMDSYADRLYITYTWQETNKDGESVKLHVTVEIVTGEVLDLIYQIKPLETFGDYTWIQDYRKKADYFAKMIIDSVLRNTIISDKLIKYYIDTYDLSDYNAIEKLEQLTPLAKIISDAKPKINTEIIKDKESTPVSITWDVDKPKAGPIDIDYKSKLTETTSYNAPEHTIKTWGRKGSDNKVMGIWGEFVSIDYDICVADGGCIESCPVDVYEFFNTPGNSASSKKPLMSKEPDCIFCLACENVCPPQAIKIFQK